MTTSPPSEPLPCFLGSVNRWECDENDHLNVRFYAHKMNQALRIYLRGLGLKPAADNAWFAARVRSQHIRFLREARAADPLRVECAVVKANEQAIEILSLMRHGGTNAPLSAFTTCVDLCGEPSPAVPGFTALPGFAAARGIDPDNPYPPPLTPGKAEEAGFWITGRGVIASDECDGGDVVQPHVYIGRVSDGVPNLWAAGLHPDAQAEHGGGELGGAALEYRLQVQDPLRRDEVFRHLSGVRAVGNKTLHLMHLIYNESRGGLAASAEVVAVTMDRVARKAVAVSQQRRARLQALLLR